MKLPAFALFERALRVETRSPLISWARAGLLLVMLMILVPIQDMARAGWMGAPGLHFLQQVVWVNLVFITLAGLGYFASAITEEKEEMMLGLLRMTDLSPVAILLGKSTSRLVGALLLLLVQVPFVLLAVTLGGVGMLQIMAAYGTLLAYLFLVCNLALLFSVIFRNTTTAAACTLIILLTFLLGHYWARSLVDDETATVSGKAGRGLWLSLAAIIDLWRQATPSERLYEIFQTGFTGAAIGFQVIADLGLGILFFGLSWLLFDRCTREEKEAAPARQWFLRRVTSRRSRIPPGLVGKQAIVWKDFTFFSGGRFGLIVRGGLVGLLVIVWNLLAVKYDSPKALTRSFEGMALFWSSLLVTAVCMALDASRLFQEELRWKTLSSLVTLPMSLPEVAYRKVLGSLMGTLPLLAGVLLGCVLDSEDVGSFLQDASRDPIAFFILAVLVLQFILFLHLTAFLSLILKRGALPLAVAIQYLGGSFLIMFLGIIFSIGGGGQDVAYVICIFIGGICVAGSLLLHHAIGQRLMRAAAEE